MLPLAVALTLAATPAADGPPRPSVVVLAAKRTPACGPDIDPHFVMYVAPPRHTGANPLLWLIAGQSADPMKHSGPGCLRPLQTSDRGDPAR